MSDEVAMSAAMIRTGGIMALLTVPIVLVLGLLIVAGSLAAGSVIPTVLQ